MEKREQNKYVLILVENSRYTPTEITDIASFTKYYVVEIPVFPVRRLGCECLCLGMRGSFCIPAACECQKFKQINIP